MCIFGNFILYSAYYNTILLRFLLQQVENNIQSTSKNIFTRPCIFIVFQLLLITLSNSYPRTNSNDFKTTRCTGILLINVEEDAERYQIRNALVIRWVHGGPPKSKFLVTGGNCLQFVAGGGRETLQVLDQYLARVNFGSMSFPFGACTFLKSWSEVVSSQYIKFLNRQPA